MSPHVFNEFFTSEMFNMIIRGFELRPCGDIFRATTGCINTTHSVHEVKDLYVNSVYGKGFLWYMHDRRRLEQWRVCPVLWLCVSDKSTPSTGQFSLWQ